MVFLGAVVTGTLGLILGPRRWIQRLCKWILWITGGFLLLLTGALLSFTVAGAQRGEIETGAVLLFVNLLCFPLLCAFLGLLAVCVWRVCPSKG